MKNTPRIFIALAVFLFGAGLVPFVGLPSSGFSWQRYADVYNPPALDINHDLGAVGSFFTVSGFNFTPSGNLTAVVNGQPLGSLDADANGDFAFIIDTATPGVTPGYYFVSIAPTSDLEAVLTQIGEKPNYQILTTSQIMGPTVAFRLEPTGTVHPQVGSGPIFVLPANIGLDVKFLPIILR
jgi:hypothetical protein